MGLAWTVVGHIVDDKGARSDVTYHVPSSVSFANVIEFAQSAFILIDSLITGQLEGFSVIATEYFTSGVKTAPVAGSDVEEGARFGFLTDQTNDTKLRLPTFDEAHMVAGSALVDLTDSDVIAFITAMTGGIDLAGAGPIVSPSDARDEDIVSLAYAKDAFTASR